MSLVFGSGFFGKTAQFNEQWVETKFFHVWFIPLFPLSSMFVTGSKFRQRSGFNLALDKKSVIATYCRLLFSILTLYYLSKLVWADDILFVAPEEAQKIMIFNLLKALFYAALVIYFFFFYGKASEEDRLVRTKMGSVTGLYAMPHWFSFEMADTFLTSLEAQYKLSYPDSDWKIDLMHRTVSTEQIPLLYGLATFNCMVHDLPENEQLFYKADKLYVLD